jgi:hypothetical protein
VYEYIFSAFLWLDETEPFGCVKPFHGAVWHVRVSFFFFPKYQINDLM